jgi:nucleoside-diphosphate-sugar epimerase
MILVTGASGVIGRAFVARLNAERLPFVVMNREVLGRGIPLAAALSCKPSVVVHLAAVVPQSPSIPDDEVSAAHTRDIDMRVLEASIMWGCHMVYASGCSLDPKTDLEPIREEAAVEQSLASAYLRVKQQGERDFLASGHATVLRISAPVGEGMPSATVLGRFMAAAKVGGVLEVWGSGKREQNYVDVVDLADALFRVLVVRPYELINIAADQPVTMLELANQVVQVCGRGVVRSTENPDPRDGEPARYSNHKAANLLGWRPVSPLRASLENLSKAML